jgi:hypothetical protein
MSGLTHAYDEMMADGFDAQHIARAWLTASNASTSPSAEPIRIGKNLDRDRRAAITRKYATTGKAIAGTPKPGSDIH